MLMVDVVGGGIYINIYYRYGILPPPDSVLVIVWTVGDEDVFDASSVRLGDEGCVRCKLRP